TGQNDQTITRNGGEVIAAVPEKSPERYGSDTVVASPVDEMLNVPAAVSPDRSYAAQPAGCVGTRAMNGPPVWDWLFVTLTESWLKFVATTPMCAWYIDTADARVRESACALATRARAWMLLYSGI